MTRADEIRARLERARGALNAAMYHGCDRNEYGQCQTHGFANGIDCLLAHAYELIRPDDLLDRLERAERLAEAVEFSLQITGASPVGFGVLQQHMRAALSAFREEPQP